VVRDHIVNPTDARFFEAGVHADWSENVEVTQPLNAQSVADQRMRRPKPSSNRAL
jgi:hypothetical protein